MTIKKQTYSEKELNDISSYIISKEWAFHAKAFWDNGRWSIWYWTISYRWEVISKEEWIRRFENHLNPLYDIVNLSCYNDNQKKALVSYMYNTGGYQMNMRYYVKNCRYNDIRYIMSVWGWWHGTKYYNWLSKRREEEINLFIN